MRKRYEGDKDVYCDSKLMLGIMHKFGENVCTKLHWLADDDLIYLVIENMSFHWKIYTVKKWSKALKENHSIAFHQQNLRSPKSKILTLGDWLGNKKVDKTYKHNVNYNDDPEYIFMNVWDELEAYKPTNIWVHFRKILRLIVIYGGGNELVESSHGLWKNPRNY